MKVAIITDQHFGARNDSTIFLDFYQKFYEETFFPRLREEKIDAVLILGDTFDRRKYLNFYTLKRAKEMFFDPLAYMDIPVHILAGNHDTYFKNTNDVNSVDLLLGEYGILFNVIDHPSHIYVGPHKICMMPWICPENYEDSMETLKDSDASICCGHFEIDGFQMYRGMPSQEGLKRDYFRKFDFTFSGHYHHKSSRGNIHYLGSAAEYTWSDYNDPRGFSVFDTSTRVLEFFQNPYKMFRIARYDDVANPEIVERIQTTDFSRYRNTYVKLVVINKSNPYAFDLLFDSIYKAGPLDIAVIEDASVLLENEESDTIDEAEDTATILRKYISGLTLPVDNDRMKDFMLDVYNEALQVETV